MARSHLRYIIRPANGLAIQNARVNLYDKGTSTPRTDAWNNETGGAQVSSLISNNQGEVEAWLDSGGDLDLEVTSNSGTAYYITTRAPVSFSTFRETVTIGSEQFDGNFVDTSSDQIISGRKSFTGTLSVKSDPWVDMRDPAFGNYDPIAADNSPSVTAAFAYWAAHGGVLLIPGGITNYSTSVTTTRKQGEIRGLQGLNSTLNYTGPGGVPAIKLLNCAHLWLHDFKVTAQPSSGQCTYLIESQYNSVTNTGGGVTRNRFSNLYCGASNPADVNHVIGATLAAGSADGNNDLMTLDHVTAINTTGYLFRAEHSQSKGHMLSNCNIGVCGGLIDTSAGVGGGHFTIVGGNVSNSTGPVIKLGPPRESVSIINLAAENCSQYLVQTSGNVTNWNVSVIGGSSIGTLLHASGVEMQYFSGGPFVVEGFFFDRADAVGTPVPNPVIKMAVNPSFAKGSAVVRGCVWRTQNSAAFMDTVVDRQPATGGGHVIVMAGNLFHDAANAPVIQPARIYGQASFIGAFTTGTRPAVDLTDGDSIYDSTLDKPAWWKASDSTWRDATGATI